MTLRCGSLTITNRLILGTGGAPNHQVIMDTIEASRTEVVTVSLRRYQPSAGPSLYRTITERNVAILPNTAGAHNAREAVLLAQLGREALQTNRIKVEVVMDDRTLLPDPVELVRATQELVADDFEVFAYTNDDPSLARILEATGVVAVMPLGSPIGSGLGLLNRHNLSLIRDLVTTSLILDAGIGTASDAAIAMELGFDGVLVASAITRAQDPLRMARAVALAVEAGQLAREAGRIPPRPLALASTPTEGLPDFIYTDPFMRSYATAPGTSQGDRS
jgi:thiazole synthase